MIRRAGLATHIGTALLLYAPPPVLAEALFPEQVAICDGSVVSRIEFRSHKPSEQTAAERAAAATTDAVRLEHQRTRAFVLRAYLRFQEGDPY